MPGSTVCDDVLMGRIIPPAWFLLGLLVIIAVGVVVPVLPEQAGLMQYYLFVALKAVFAVALVWLTGWLLATSSSMLKVKVLPLPSTLCAQTRPSCSSINSLTMESPIPIPSNRRCIWRST